jgi:hypothetical protein
MHEPEPGSDAAACQSPQKRLSLVFMTWLACFLPPPLCQQQPSIALHVHTYSGIAASRLLSQQDMVGRCAWWSSPHSPAT